MIEWIEVRDEYGDWLWKQQDSLCHKLRVSAAYHSRRERFFDLAERWFQAFAALSATAAFAQIAGDPMKDAPARWFALCAAVASIRLIFNSTWKRHVPGCLRAAVLSDAALEAEVRVRAQAHGIIARNASFSWWDGSVCPRIAFMDSQGRAVASENPEHSLGDDHVFIGADHAHLCWACIG